MMIHEDRGYPPNERRGKTFLLYNEGCCLMAAGAGTGHTDLEAVLKTSMVVEQFIT